MKWREKLNIVDIEMCEKIYVQNSEWFSKGKERETPLHLVVIIRKDTLLQKTWWY